MTLSQFVDLVRNRHRATGDTNWSDAEIYAIVTTVCNEVLSLIGLIEATDSSQTTVAGTQAYTFPSNCAAVKQLNYNGVMLQEISFREWEIYKNGGTTPSGTPLQWVNWAGQANLIPVPDAVGTLTFYYEKQHPFIDGSSQTTIDLPAVLHGRLANKVIANMYEKDLNQGLARQYEEVWHKVDLPAIMNYARRMKRRGRARVLIDADTMLSTDVGTI